MLFDIEKEDIDFFDVCQNSSPYLDSHEKMKTFDVGRLYLKERDRTLVSDAIHTGKMNRKYFMMVLIHSIERNFQQGVMIAAREFYLKIPDELFASVLAFSHPGGSNKRLKFPAKHHKIPKSLFTAFGIRSDQTGWLHKLASNEAFIRLVSSQLSPKDWDYLPLFDTTLLHSPPKQVTAPQSQGQRRLSEW